MVPTTGNECRLRSLHEDTCGRFSGFLTGYTGASVPAHIYGHHMDTHALRVLEFDAIRKQLAGQTACSLGRERAEAMTPSDWLPQAQARLDETTECRTLINAKGNLPLGGITDIRPLICGRRRSARRWTRTDCWTLSASPPRRARSNCSCKRSAQDYPIMAERASGLGQFPSLESEINASIGLNGMVLDSASPELARIRSRRKVASSADDGAAERHRHRPDADHAARPGDRPARRPLLRPRQGRPPGRVRRHRP